MEYEEAKEKIIGFLDKKTEFSKPEQFLLLKALCNEVFDEAESELVGDIEPEEIDDFDDESEDESYYEESETKAPRIQKVKPIINKPAPVVKKDTEQKEDNDVLPSLD